MLYDGAKLRAWRLAAGLTVTEGAAALGLSYPRLLKLENGHAPDITLGLLTRLANHYGHDVAELLPARAAS